MKRLLIATLLAAAGWLAALPAQAVPTLSIVPSSPTVGVGGNVQLDLVISGLTADNEIVSGFDLDIFFDPAVLNANVLSTTCTPWGTCNDILLEQNFVAPGHVEFILIALQDDAFLDALQGDSIVLSTIGLTGLADGFSFVNFGADLDFERNVTGRRAESLTLNVLGTCIAVGTGSCNQVPEPATASLLLLGLAAGGWAVRRRRQAA